MSKMATVPVFACRVCGTPVYATHLSTAGQDGNAKKLKLLMDGLSKIALCDYHKAKRNWYATQGREEEFIKNELNPETVIYSVVDVSGADYYGRKQNT